MYRLNVLLIFAVVYLGMHMVTGYFYCEDNFCPGDNERDYVYSVTDEDGKTWYREDGKFLTEEEYKQAHANIIEFVNKKDEDGIKK